MALSSQKRKRLAYKEHIRDNRLIITADTIVSTAEGVLGKPQDEQAARDMLRLISGREHTVTTAFTLNTTECHVSQAVTTVVKFAPLTERDDWILHSSFSSFDKAGALRHSRMDWTCGCRIDQRILFKRGGFAHTAAIWSVEQTVIQIELFYDKNIMISMKPKILSFLLLPMLVACVDDAKNTLLSSQNSNP